MVVAESGTDQSWAVTLADRFALVEVVGRELELDLQEACWMWDTEAVVAVVAVVAVAEACRPWKLDPQEVEDMETAAAFAVAAAYRS